jgi:hypothetical protein
MDQVTHDGDIAETAPAPPHPAPKAGRPKTTDPRPDRQPPLGRRLPITTPEEAAKWLKNAAAGEPGRPDPHE